MRPSDIDCGIKRYECFVCGTRSDRSSGRQCSECGGELQHLGRSRDL